MAEMDVTFQGEVASTVNVVHRGEKVVWNVTGVDAADETRIRGFRKSDGISGKPMVGDDDRRRCTGNGTIQDRVADDAEPGRYTYDITTVRAGVETVVDPEIQIKP